MPDNSERRRMTVAERRAQKSKQASLNPFGTVSAAQRRAERRTTTRSSASTVRSSDSAVLSSEKVAELLENPTKIVTEAELRQQYSYVERDLRNMGVLALGLVVFLVLLATFLPR